MSAKDSLGRAIAVKLLRRQNAQSFEDRVAEAFSVRRGTHQPTVDDIRYLDAGESRRRMQRGYFLRNVQDAAAILHTSPARGGNVKPFGDPFLIGTHISTAHRVGSGPIAQLVEIFSAPLHHLAQPFLPADFWLPADIVLDGARIEPVTGILPEPVG